MMKSFPDDYPVAMQYRLNLDKLCDIFKILIFKLDELFYFFIGLQHLGQKTMAKHLSDCFLHCLSDFFYLPTVKNRV